MAELGGIRLLEPRCDLGQARVAGDERRAAGSGGLGRDHPERLGEDRRHDAGVGEREQVPEMAVLERTGEQRLDATLGSERFERRALGPESDDDEAGVEPGERLDQDVHALLLDQLAEVDDDGRLRARGTLRAASALPSSGRRSSALPGFGGSRRASSRSAASATSRGSGTHSSMSTPGGTSTTFSVCPHTSRKTVRMCSEPTNVARAAGERLRAPGGELGVAAHRVLELGAVRLDGERRARSPRRPGRRAERDW